MSGPVVGLVHPGEMGSAIARALVEIGTDVAWASDGRSGDTAARAAAAGLFDAGGLAALARRSDVLLSVCPPHAAEQVARQVAAAGFVGIFVDANAIAPATVRGFAGVVGGGIGAASAVKMAYTAWTKASAALLLTAHELAAAEGVADALAAEWAISQPGLAERHRTALRSARSKGWRWRGEMEEIAAAMRAHELPDGFHLAAAEMYRRADPDTAARP